MHADTCHPPSQVINARKVPFLLPEATNSANEERNKLPISLGQVIR
jgi:hypothetical protein